MNETTTKYPIHPIHDVSYKHLLSNKYLFLELLHSFIKTNWVKEINQTSLIKVDKSYITTDFNTTEADLVYRINLKDTDVIFYLLTELQSTVDFSMPYRLLVYMTEIWKDIWNNTPEKERSRKSYRLPIILPIVIYNGANNWTALRSFREMLNGYQYDTNKMAINFSYILIDINRLNPKDLINLSNEIGAIFLLDQKYDIIELKDRFTSVVSVIKKMDYQRYQNFIRWFGKSIYSQLTIDHKEELLELLEKSSREEVDHMISNLAENVRRAQEEAKLKGMKKGIKEGMEKGMEKGMERGMEKGIKQGKIEIAKNMLKRNLPLEAIIDITELPIEEIKKLINEIKKEK